MRQKEEKLAGVAILGAARYSQPLDSTNAKKYRALAALRDIFVIGFSQDLKGRRFTESAHFYLLPKWPYLIRINTSVGFLASFLRSVETIGDAGEVPVAIPHAVFKILVKDSGTGGAPDVLAFIYEQPRDDYQRCPVLSRRVDDDADAVVYDHTDNLSSIKEIEDKTGLTFFRNLAMKKADLAAFKNQTATALWPVEDRFYGRRCHG